MALIAAIFFISGSTALLYEVVWMRQLTLIFGVSTYAVSTILATYMGGLALGSFLFGTWSDRSTRPLLAYALIETAIGVYALILPLLFGALREPYIYLFRLELPYTALTLGRAVLAATVLLTPTILMGGTLPILAKHLVSSYGDVGRQTSLLYFVNTAGAVAGCTAGGFYLIEHLGVRGTTHLAAGSNLALAVAATGLYALGRPAASPSTGSTSNQSVSLSAAVSSSMALLTLICICMSGFVSLAYEVFWTRALLRYLHNSTYAFTSMLAVFLLGLAVGSAVYVALPFRKSRPVLLFAALEIGAGLSSLLSLHLFENMPSLSKFFAEARVHSLVDSVQLMLFRSSLILFLPGVFFGATLPLASEIYAARIDRVGTSVGRVYGVNTIGAISGSLAASFALIPFLGMQGTLALLISMNLGLGAVLAVGDIHVPQRKAIAGVAMGSLLVAALYSMPPDVFRRTFPGRPGSLLFYREGASDTVGVVEISGQRAILYEDLRGTASTHSHPLNFILGHLPVLLHPGEPKSGLHICFGVGNSLSAFAAHESIRELDSVELSPHVLEVSKYFWTNNDIINNPKVTTIIEDGRNFVMATDKIYDVIELEPPEPFTAGVINLYTREFYQNVRRILADDGVFMQWINTATGSFDDIKMLYRAFFDVFPHATAWQQLSMPGPVLLIGTKSPLLIDYQRLKEKMQRFRVREDLALCGLRTADDLLAMFLFGPATMKTFLDGVEPVTDDRTVLDFSMARHVASGYGFGVFSLVAGREGLDELSDQSKRLWAMRESILPYLTNLEDEDPEALERRIRERELPAMMTVFVNAQKIKQSEWNRWPAQE